MSTVTDKLQELIAAKSDMKTAIIEKGVTPTGGLSTYAAAIRNIEGTGGDYSSERLVEGTKFAYSTFKEFPNYDTSFIKDMQRFFYECNELVSVPMINTSNVTDMSYMFYNCRELETVPLFDTSNVKTMAYMFYNRYIDFDNFSKLNTVPLFDTSNVETMSYMFYNRTNIVTVPKFDTSNVTNMNYMFAHCTSLKTIPQLDTSKVHSIVGIFDTCQSLETVPLLDFTNVKYIGNSSTNDLFYSCHKLKNLGGLYNLGYQSELTGMIRLDSTDISRESFLNLVNNLYDRAAAGYDIVSISISEEIRDRILVEDIAIATNKGWRIVQY